MKLENDYLRGREVGNGEGGQKEFYVGFAFITTSSHAYWGTLAPPWVPLSFGDYICSFILPNLLPSYLNFAFGQSSL